MTVLAIIDIGYEYDGKWCRLTDWFKAFLYFERIVEQTIHQKDFYNHGVVPDDDKEKERFMRLQGRYLVPMIRHQMDRNGDRRGSNQEETERVEVEVEDDRRYVDALFEHFCDSKRDWINLTCIEEERESMHPSLDGILFRNKSNEIDDENIKLIFPNLKQFKNAMGYWIQLGVEEESVHTPVTEAKYEDGDDDQDEDQWSQYDITPEPSNITPRISSMPDLTAGVSMMQTRPASKKKNQRRTSFKNDTV